MTLTLAGSGLLRTPGIQGIMKHLRLSALGIARTHPKIAKDNLFFLVPPTTKSEIIHLVCLFQFRRLHLIHLGILPLPIDWVTQNPSIFKSLCSEQGQALGQAVITWVIRLSRSNSARSIHGTWGCLCGSWKGPNRKIAASTPRVLEQDQAFYSRDLLTIWKAALMCYLALAEVEHLGPELPIEIGH